MTKIAESKLAYICSPYRENIELHIQIAKRISVKAFNKGYLPLCLHTFLEGVTGLKEEFDRPFILATCLDYLKKCDVVIVNTNHALTKGMKAELDLARELKKEILTYNNGKII